MHRSQRSLWMFTCAALLIATACASRAGGKEPAAAKPAPAKPAPPKPAPAKTEVPKPDAPKAADDAPARRELRDIAERTYDETVSFFETSEATPFEVYQASRRWMDTELALTQAAEDKVTFRQAHLDRMRDLANTSLWRTSEVEFYVAEAELQLAEVRPDPALIPTVLARKALQGDWEVVSAEEEGAAIKRPDLKSLTILGRRGEFTFRLGAARALLTIDPTVTPHLVDIFGFNESFPFGGHGIYKLEADRLTLCWSPSGERPKDFATRAGDDSRLYVLKRVKAQ